MKTVRFDELFKEENGEYTSLFNMIINGQAVASHVKLTKDTFFTNFPFSDLIDAKKINVEINNGFIYIISIGEEVPFRFTKDLIKEVGLQWKEYVSPNPKTPKDKYGRAESKGGRLKLGWQHDYYSEGVHHLTIEEDAGSRKVFHGEISNKADFKLILKLVH